MTAWLVYSIITGAFLALAAQGAEWLLKSARRPVRGVWFVAIALTIGLTLAAPLRTEPEVRIAAAFSMTMQATPAQPTREPTLVESVRAAGRDLMEAMMMPFETATSLAAVATPSLNRGMQWGALASAVVALIVLLTVYARSMRERHNWPTMQLLGRTVRVTPNVGPAVLGLAPPEIVVPQWVLLRDAEEQRLVLEHESEHVNANDPMLLMCACIAVACMPWNPAVWFMWSRLRLAVELDCDRRVLAHGVQKPAYGKLLVELSANRPFMSPAIPAFSWGTSHLEQRLVAMTARPKRFHTLRRVASGVVVATALLAAIRAELPAELHAELHAMETNDILRTDIPQVAIPAESGRSERVMMQKVELARAAVELRAASVMAQGVAQDTIPRKKVRQPPVVIKKTPIRKGSSDSVSKVVRYKMADSATALPRKVRAADFPSSKPTLLTGEKRSTRVYYNGKAGGYDSVVVHLHDPNSRTVGDSGKLMSVSTDTIVLADSTLSAVNAGSRIRIRGQASSVPLNDGNKPLIIVDGFVFVGAIDTLDPNKIESIEVIKGVKAEKLYGAIGANGVISIKTKR